MTLAQDEAAITAAQAAASKANQQLATAIAQLEADAGTTPPTDPPIVIAAIPVTDVNAGASISVALVASGGDGTYQWTLGPAAPTGLALAAGTNVVRGILAAGTYDVPVDVTDGTVSASYTFTIIVAPLSTNAKPSVPAGTMIPSGAPVKSYKFAGATTLDPDWSPTWFGDGNTQNGTKMSKALVTFTSGLGVDLGITATAGSIISTNPSDGQHASGKGFQIVPTASQPVFIQYNGKNLTAATLKNWLAVWLDGQSWPADSELDVMEAFNAFWAHLEFPNGSGGVSNPGVEGGKFVAGDHSFGALWSLGSAEIFYDGLSIGTLKAPGYLNEPMYLIAENSKPSGGSATPSTFTLSEVDVWQGPLVAA